MKTIKLSILLLALLTFGQAKAQGLSGSGTTQDPYLITSNADWTTFAQSVTNGTTYSGQTVKLTADITVSTMAGVENKSFAGTFDGDGHTITLALSGSGNGTALFSDINGATLKNLKAQGNVTTDDRRPATFVVFVFGNSTISNCWSTVAVSSTRTSGWVDGGGMVSRVSSNATLNMTDCAFHGTVTFTTGATSGGGMIGYTQSNATVNLTNCLYSPTTLTLNVNEYNPRIFVSGEVSGNLTNCYYNAVAAASVLANQGIDASEMTNAALAAALGKSWHVYNGMVVPYIGEYVISSTAEWNTFAQSVTDGKTYAGQILKLTNDISVTTMAGDENTSFAGAFDGQGHVITLNMTASVQFTSLFCNADGATFQNLKVDGTINTSKKFCAGFAGAVINNGCTFFNCVSDVTINSSINGDGTHGGLVAYVGKGNNTFEGCAFTGKLLGANTNYVGGLVGFTDSRNNATVSFTNCVFHPQQVTMSGSGSQTFARWYSNNSGSVSIGDNCYYSQTLGAAQGKQMRSITGGDYVTVAFSGEATTYERSGISAYSVGIVYDSTLYAGSDDTVSLNLSCTPPSGYVLSSYTTSAGTLTGTANPYTLTMPNEAVTIQAVVLEPLDPVAYIDENGVEQQCTFYTVVTDTLNFYDLPAGWYVVSDSITLDDRNVHFSGDAHLILCDGATMNISVNNGDALSADGSLTLYGQSAGTGSLTATSDVNEGINAFNLTINGCTVNATSTDDTGAFNGIDANDLTINGSTVTASGTNYGIYTDGLTINGSTVTATGSSIGIFSIDLTINGSTVTASANDDGGIGIGANRVTINSGTVNATGNDSGIYIGYVSGYVTINGGTVTTNEIYSPMVTLGWSDTNDSITVGSFDYYDPPTVSVKSGKAFYYQNGNDTVVVSGTLTTGEIAALSGKTLVPYGLAPVAYVDGNGTEHTCSHYTVLEGGGATTLTAGWYVVDDDITYNGILSLNGDVTLILGNSKTMTMGTDDENEGGIKQSSTGNLTIYGQSLSPDEAGTLNATQNRFPQFESDFDVITATPTGRWRSINVSNYTQHSGNVIAGAEAGKAISADSFVINGGSINANSSDFGIFSNGNITINGGNVIADAGFGKAISANSFTINGGSINVTSRDYGIFTNGDMNINGGSIHATCNNYGIYTKGDMNINGGNVTGSVNTPSRYWCGLSGENNIIINGGTVESNGIYTYNNIILGFTKISDQIHVTNYYTARDGTVSVKSGEAFYYENGNETVVVSGTLSTEEIAAIAWKTLRPYIEPCATPFNLEVTDISATSATLQWMGIQDSYNVKYRPVERAGEWVVVTANTTTLNLTNLVPETEYEWQVQGIDCDGNGGTTEWSEWAFFTTLAGINFAVTGYGQGNGGYYLIASPFSEINPLNVTNMLSGNHDLYAFVPNPSDSLEWHNYVADTFNLIAGKGYLYANADTVTLTFRGTPYSGNGEFALVYDSTDARKCWNLVGNPFPWAAYLDRPYYVLNADGTGIDPEPIPASVPVQPCTAVFVKAVGVNDRVVFSLGAQP